MFNPIPPETSSDPGSGEKTNAQESGEGNNHRNIPQDLDAYKLVAQELHSLSCAERDEAIQDVHGAATIKDEDSNHVQFCLQQLEKLIFQQKQSHQPNDNALQLAIQHSPNYVRSLFLMFLRCCQFQIEHTVKRLEKYFDVKLWLFGMNKLCTDIVQSDFSVAGQRLLRAGYFQVLPSRDSARRVVLLINASWCETIEQYEPENVVRLSSSRND